MPKRFRDIISHVQAHGVSVTKGGNHWKLSKEGFRCYPISAHNGEKSEITDVYVKGVCKHFKLPKM